MIINEDLSKIISTYWQDFQDKKNYDFVVNPSIPVIWFGNIEKYNDSQLKIVTVSINPSKKEFEDDTGKSSFWRFKDISQDFSNKKSLNEDDILLLVNAYNSYFGLNPYASYFNYYEKVLENYFDCDYHGQKKNTAIHIDLYTPIATEYWKNLSEDEKGKIQPFSGSPKNEKFILEFLNYLEPNIVLFSTRKDELKKVFKIDLENDKICEQNLKRGFSMILYKTNKQYMILYGRNNYGKPFNLGGVFINKAKSCFLDNIKKQNNDLII